MLENVHSETPYFCLPQNRIKFEELSEPKIMVATFAFHRYGNLSSEKPRTCYVYGEQDKYFVGCWIGYFPNFHDILFPKTHTQEISREKQREYVRENPITWEDLQRRHIENFKIR